MNETEFVDQRLKLQHLKIVMGVATWGSMAKAARHLTISQPVVSKVIRKVKKLKRLIGRSVVQGQHSRAGGVPVDF
jgi:molybdenum-dependent DNA-binding transcriptional regulator ModE